MIEETKCCRLLSLHKQAEHHTFLLAIDDECMHMHMTNDGLSCEMLLDLLDAFSFCSYHLGVAGKDDSLFF
jgi:hypothetical protein